MIFLLLTFLKMSIYSHDVQIAVYNIAETEDELIIEITFEKDDLTKVLKKKDASEISDQIQSYIKKHLSIQLNQNAAPLKFMKVVEEGKHFKVKAKSPKSYTSLHQVDIQNTCLLHLDGHSNIIQLRLNQKERDFLMNKNRTTLQIEY